MKNIQPFILLFIIATSCESLQQGKVKGNFVLSDTTIIKISKEVEPTTYSMQYKDGFIYWWNKSKQTISRLDIKKGHSENFLSYDYEGPNGIGNPLGFYIHNEDSIFFPKNGTNFIFLLNKNGVILNVYDYYDKNFKLSPAASYSTFGMEFKEINNKLIILNQGFNPYSLNPESQLKEYFPFIQIDYKTGYSNVLDFQFKSEIIKDLAVGFGSAYTVVGGKIFCKLHDSRYLYIFDIETESQKSVYLESNLIKNYTNEYLIGTREMDINTFQRKFYKSAKTIGFAYDPFRKVFYEFGWPGNEIDSSNRPLTNFSRFLPSFVINIYNEEFDLIGDHQLPSNLYLPHLFYINEEGLNLFANHPDNPNFVNENQMEIHTLVFKEN